MAELRGGTVFKVSEIERSEYSPNRGVFFANMLGRARGDAFGFYQGTIQPGCEIAREIHPDTSETVYVLSGQALGIVDGQEVALQAGQVLHVEKNVHHGLRNVGQGALEFLVIGHPDF